MSIKKDLKGFLAEYGFQLAILLAVIQILFVGIMRLRDQIPYLAEMVTGLTTILSIFVYLRCYILSSGMKIRFSTVILAFGILSSYLVNTTFTVLNISDNMILNILLVVLNIVQAIGYILFGVQILVGKELNGKKRRTLAIAALCTGVALFSFVTFQNDILTILAFVVRWIYYPALALALKKEKRVRLPLEPKY